MPAVARTSSLRRKTPLSRTPTPGPGGASQQVGTRPPRASVNANAVRQIKSTPSLTTTTTNNNNNNKRPRHTDSDDSQPVAKRRSLASTPSLASLSGEGSDNDAPNNSSSNSNNINSSEELEYESETNEGDASVGSQNTDSLHWKETEDEGANFISESSVKEPARQIIRTIILYPSFKSMFSQGFKRIKAITEGETNDEKLNEIMKNNVFESFQLLEDLIPGIQDYYAETSVDGPERASLWKLLKDNSNAGRTADTSTLKTHALDIMTYTGPDPTVSVPKDDLPMKSTDKHHLGFRHDFTGHLLCPARYNWEDDSVKQNIRSGKIKVLATDFPNFCYPTGQYDNLKAAKGLFRGRACIKAAQAIFTGPSSCLEGRERASTRAGNAQLAGITTMTSRSIAYVVCQVRFMLSNVQTWRLMDGAFNLEQFYWNCVSAIEQKKSFERELISFWNMEIFGTDDIDEDPTQIPSQNGSDGSTTRKEPSMMDLLAQQDSDSED